MRNPLQQLRKLILGREKENGYHYGQEGAFGEQQSPGGDEERPVYTALDIGTAYAKAIIIDGQVVTNPIGFRGRHFSLTLFSAFAPLMQLGALETVAQGLDLTLVTIVAEPYALARCLSTNASAESGAIFIDIGGGTTDIALVRQGGIEDTRMFALRGRTFTRRLAASKGLPLKDAEKLKLNYGSGGEEGDGRDELHKIFDTEDPTRNATV